MDVSDIFYFFLLGEGKRRVQGARSRAVGRFFVENARRGGGVFQERGGGGEGPGGFLQRIMGGGGGLNFFFRGRNSHQVFKYFENSVFL